MTRPRLAFVGLGWIGRNRLEAVARSGKADIAWLVDPDPANLGEAASLVPAAALADRLPASAAPALDGVVIATPNALHAGQSISALSQGLSVFCQKPLGRNGPETQAVVTAARDADRLLGVDLSYRWTAATQALHDLVRSEALGRIHALDLTFHNAYGPDKPWFRDFAQSGGGCLLDLGIHLVDLAFWLLGGPSFDHVDAHLSAGGQRLDPGATILEDYAIATLRTCDDTVVRLACSWNLPAGREALIEARIYGTKGGAGFHNVDGSYHDFRALRFNGTREQVLVEPPDDWGGRAILDWVTGLAAGRRFDPAAHQLVASAQLLDRLYGRT